MHCSIDAKLYTDDLHIKVVALIKSKTGLNNVVVEMREDAIHFYSYDANEPVSIILMDNDTGELNTVQPFKRIMTPTECALSAMFDSILNQGISFKELSDTFIIGMAKRGYVIATGLEDGKGTVAFMKKEHGGNSYVDHGIDYSKLTNA